MSFKKTVLAASSVAIFGMSASALAATPSLFVGAQLGHQSVDTDITVSDSWSPNTVSLDYSATGLAGGVFAGAKFDVTPQFYLAPEINLGYSNADGGQRLSSGTYSATTEIEAKRTYGLGLMAGYAVTPSTNVYGRLGYQRTKFEASWNESDPAWNYSESGSDSKTFGGVRYGVGVETAMTDSLGLRFEWNQTRYSSETFTETDQWGDEEYTRIKPTEDLFQIGLTFSF